MNYLLLSIFFLLLVVISSYIRIGFFLNPVSLFISSLTMNLIAIYVCDNLGLLRLYSISDTTKVGTVYNIATLAFALPWITIFPDKSKTYDFFDKSKSVKVAKYISIGIILGLIAGFILLGGTPIIKMFTGSLEVVEYNESLKGLPLGFLTIILTLTILLYLYLSSFIANRKDYNMGKLWIIYFLIICVVGALWQGKRQGLLMLIFMILARFGQKKIELSFFKRVTYLVVLGGAFFLIFSQVSKIRTNADDTDNYELLSYAMYPAMNLVTIVDHFPLSGSTILPRYTVSEIIPNRFGPNANSDTSDSFLFESTSPSGYLAYWYEDYGYWGIGIGVLALSFFSKKMFLERNKSEHNMRAYVLILWCCAMAGVYSHFISLNFFIFPYCILCLINKLNLTSQ